MHLLTSIREYSFPAVQKEVLSLIELEMKSFKLPAEPILSYLPMPDLKFSRAPGFKVRIDRVSLSVKNAGVAQGDIDAHRMENLIDLKRYAVPGPERAAVRKTAQILSALSNARGAV